MKFLSEEWAVALSEHLNGSDAFKEAAGTQSATIQQIITDGEEIPLDEALKKAVLDVNRDMAGQALRVLGVAYKPMDRVPDACDSETVERGLTFVGLTGMIDPPMKKPPSRCRAAAPIPTSPAASIS